MASHGAYAVGLIEDLDTAVRELGGGRIRLQLLGFPDGGLEQLLHGYWRRDHPELSPTTGAREPPYPMRWR